MALTDKLTAIANAIRAKTGKTGALSLEQMVTEIGGITTGITPTGTKSITTNGTHDVTNYASANVKVPSSGGGGVTPTGTKEITANGEYDVSEFAKAAVNLVGLNARMFTTTVATTTSSGNLKIAGANEFLASIRSNPNAFMIVLMLDPPTSTSMSYMWMNANFKLAYGGTSAKNTLHIRSSTSSVGCSMNTNGLAGTNYSGHLNVGTDGSITATGINSAYPILAGEYLIIAGTKEML